MIENDGAAEASCGPIMVDFSGTACSAGASAVAATSVDNGKAPCAVISLLRILLRFRVVLNHILMYLWHPDTNVGILVSPLTIKNCFSRRVRHAAPNITAAHVSKTPKDFAYTHARGPGALVCISLEKSISSFPPHHLVSHGGK